MSMSYFEQVDDQVANNSSEEEKQINEEKKQDYSVNFNLKYSLSDENFLKMPPLKKSWNNKDFQQNIRDLPDNVQEAAKVVEQYFEQEICTWNFHSKNGQIKDFRFNLPPSGFSAKFPITTYKYNYFITEQNQQVALSPQQLAQIQQTGTFEVASQKYPYPYTWQLSAWVIKGLVKIKESYTNDISLLYAQVLYMKNRINSKRISVKKGVIESFKLVQMMFSTIIGFRCMQFNLTDTQIHEKLERKRQKRLNDQDQNEIAMFQYFSVMNEQDKKELKEREERLNDFDQILKEFNKIQDKVRFEIDDIYEELKEKKDEVFEEDKEEEVERKQLKEQNKTNILEKYNIVVDINLPIEQSKNEILQKIQNVFITSSHLTSQEQQHLQHLIEVQKLLIYNKTLSEEKYSEKMNQYIAKIKEEYPIRSRVNQFYRDQVEKKQVQYKDEINKEQRLQLQNQIQDKYPGQGKLYADYAQNEISYDQNFKNFKKNLIQKHQVPAMTFVTHRNLFPPYEVEQYESNCGKIQYRLKRKTQYETTTAHYFWRIILFFVRWYGYTLNSMFNLFVFGIVGPLGLRALIGTKPFYPDFECNKDTGFLQKTNQSFGTVLSVFFVVIGGAFDSRDRFEAQPDTGIFGKKFARIWNLFEAYIFRILFVAIFCVLILFPIAIIVNFLVSFTLALTAWLWIPIFLVIRTLFQWFIYNFDRESCVTKNPAWFPLINLTIRLFIFGLGQIILALLSMIVIHPFVALVLLFFAHLRFGLRLIYDYIMIYIVKCLGRVPASENNLAWKIAGPGISRQFYNQIQEEDVYVLIYSEIEKAVLTQYRTQMELLIPGPKNRANKIFQNFFGAFGVTKYDQDDKSNELRNLLNEQINKRFDIYAQYPTKIAFTKQELHHLLINTKKFIKKQIDLKDMKSFIWNYYGVMELDYNGLTRQIWKRAFQNNDILEPFESVDIRMRMETDNTRHITLGLVREALEGTVNLEKEKNPQLVEKEAPSKCILQIPFVHIERIRNQLIQTQDKLNHWSSHIDQSLSVYLNLSFRKVIN